MERTVKYVGGGWIPGVPARDLTADEYETHRKAIAASAAAAGVPYYEVSDAALIDATPEAVEAAKAAGVNLTTLVGTGEGGRVLKKDVEAAAAANTAPAGGED